MTIPSYAVLFLCKDRQLQFRFRVSSHVIAPFKTQLQRRCATYQSLVDHQLTISPTSPHKQGTTHRLIRTERKAHSVSQSQLVPALESATPALENVSSNLAAALTSREVAVAALLRATNLVSPLPLSLLCPRGFLDQVFCGRTYIEPLLC